MRDLLRVYKTWEKKIGKLNLSDCSARIKLEASAQTNKFTFWNVILYFIFDKKKKKEMHVGKPIQKRDV